MSHHHSDKRSSRLSVISSIFGSGGSKSANGSSTSLAHDPPSSSINESSTRSLQKTLQPTANERNLNHAANQRSIHSPRNSPTPVSRDRYSTSTANHNTLNTPNSSLKPRSSPKALVRKPPPELTDEHRVTKMASFDSTISVMPRSKADQKIRDGIEGIIGNLETEIQNMNMNPILNYDNNSSSSSITTSLVAGKDRVQSPHNRSSDAKAQHSPEDSPQSHQRQSNGTVGSSNNYNHNPITPSHSHPPSESLSLHQDFYSLKENQKQPQKQPQSQSQPQSKNQLPYPDDSKSKTYTKSHPDSSLSSNSSTRKSYSNTSGSSINGSDISRNSTRGSSEIFRRSASVNYTSAKRNLIPASLTPTISHNIATITPNNLNDSLTHRKASSIGSAYSLSSGLNVNLSSLKKRLDLKPGEGERSSYVTMLRKTAGTAFNDVIPIKWKLPIGIRPIDNKTSARYKMANSKLGQSYKSGVELKHGHLERRLLASEIDENEEGKEISFLQTHPSSFATATSVNNGTASFVNGHTPTNSDLHSINSISINHTPNTLAGSSGTSIASLSRSTSRATATSSGGTGYQFDSFNGDIDMREDNGLSLQRSHSSGSLNENEFRLGGNYYQHNFSDKYYADDKETLNEESYDKFIFNDDASSNGRLVIANPDTDSD